MKITLKELGMKLQKDMKLIANDPKSPLHNKLVTVEMTDYMGGACHIVEEKRKSVWYTDNFILPNEDILFEYLVKGEITDEQYNKAIKNI